MLQTQKGPLNGGDTETQAVLTPAPWAPPPSHTCGPLLPAVRPSLGAALRGHPGLAGTRRSWAFAGQENSVAGKFLGADSESTLFSRATRPFSAGDHFPGKSGAVSTKTSSPGSQAQTLTGLCWSCPRRVELCLGAFEHLHSCPPTSQARRLRPREGK